VAAQQIAGAVVLGDLPTAHGEIIDGGAVDDLRLAPALWIVRIGGHGPARRRAQQLVLGVIGVGEYPIAGEIAASVVAVGRRIDVCVLIECVGGVGVTVRGEPGHQEGGVAGTHAGALVVPVVAVAERQRRAVEAVADLGDLAGNSEACGGGGDRRPAAAG